MQRAKAAEATTTRPRREAIFSRRAARLTEGPMQVKSRRARADVAVERFEYRDPPERQTGIDETEA